MNLADLLKIALNLNGASLNRNLQNVRPDHPG